MMTLLIGQLAARTGVTRSAIRYYETVGVLRPGTRTRAGYRRYSLAAIAELTFVRRGQALGFALDDIRELLELHRRGTSPCARVLSLARRRLADADAQIEDLTRFRDGLARTLARWEQCPDLASNPQAACELFDGAAVVRESAECQTD